MSKSLYSLLLIDKHAAIVKKTAQGWAYEAISGENWNPVLSENELINVITKFERKINSQYKLNKVQLTVVYDNNSTCYINKLAEILQEYNCEQWQLINYSIISKLANAKNGYECFSSLDKDWILSVLLPVIEFRLYQENDNIDEVSVNIERKSGNQEIRKVKKHC